MYVSNNQSSYMSIKTILCSKDIRDLMKKYELYFLVTQKLSLFFCNIYIYIYIFFFFTFIYSFNATRLVAVI